MKKITTLFAFLTLPAFSFTVSINNTSSFGDPDYFLTDSNGIALDNSFSIQVGFFENDSDVTSFTGSNFAQLSNSFTTFASAQAISAPADGFTVNAFIESFNNGPSPVFTGQNIYTLITSSDNSQAGVIRFDELFGQEDDLGNGDSFVAISSNASTILLGSEGGPITAQGVTFSNTFQLAEAIPEPSSAALLGLAGLALVARRKR